MTLELLLKKREKYTTTLARLTQDIEKVNSYLNVLDELIEEESILEELAEEEEKEDA